MAWVFSRLFPQLLNLFISHILSFLTCTFFIRCNFLTLLHSLALSLFLASHRTHSFFFLSQESATDFTYIHQPLGTGWEEKGWHQNKVKPHRVYPITQTGNCIHPWELGEETSLWNWSLLWQQVLQLRFQKGWMTQGVGSSSRFRYLIFLNSETQGIKN